MADPSSLPNLAARFRYAALAQADLSPVTSLASSAGAAVTVTQPTADFQPVHRTALIGGRSAALHDGVNDRLAAAATDYARNAAGFTVYAVVRADSATGVQQIVSISAGTGAGVARVSLRLSNGVPVLGGRRLDTDGFQSISGTTSLVGTGAHVLCGVLDYANAQASLYVDGTQVAFDPFQTAGLTSDTPNVAFVLGGASAQNGEFFTGAVSEALVYAAAHTAPDRATVHTYGQDEYGVTVSDYAGTAPVDLTRYAGTATPVTGTWTTAANATGDTTGTYATWTSNASGGSASLDLSGFDFSTIPAGSTVNSVTITVRSWVNNVARVTSQAAQLMDGATVIGAAQALTNSTTTTTETAFTRTPTLAQLKSSGLKVRYTAQRAAVTQSATANVDRVSVSVTYTTPAPDAGTPNVGNGALQPSRPTMSGAGASSTTGTGSLVAKVAALTAAATVSLAGVGGLVPSIPALAGAGTATATATGSLQPSAPGLAGVGTVITPPILDVTDDDAAGTGELVPARPTLTGAGASATSGAGALVPTGPAFAGAAVARSIGAGALVASRPSLSGTAAARTTATGGLAPVAPTLTGTGTVITPPVLEVTDDDAAGTGTLVPSAPTLGGLAATRSTGTGGLTPTRPLLAGAGTVITPPVLEVSDDAAVVGEGALVPARPTLAGLAWSRSTVTGTLRPTAPTLSGTGSARASLPVVLRRGISTLLAAPVGLSTPALVPVATSTPLPVLAALSSPQSAPAVLSAVEAVLAGTSTVEPTPAGTSTLTAAGVGTSTVSEGA